MFAGHNLIRPIDAELLALEEVAIAARGVLRILEDAEKCRHFEPCPSCQGAVVGLRLALSRADEFKEGR
jgi:hypothetical protein